MKPILIPNDGGKKVNILGIPMVIRIRGRDTGGVVSAVESNDVPGGGPPPHIHHREDETFQILEGDFELTESYTGTGAPETRIGHRKLVPVATVKAGKLYGSASIPVVRL